MYRTSFLSIDEKLINKQDILNQTGGREIPEDDERETERRVVYLFWSTKGELLKVYPGTEDEYFSNVSPQLSPHTHYKEWQNVKLTGSNYRVLTMKPQGEPLNINHRKVQFIQLVYNIDPEVDLLKDMLIMIGFGSAGGLVLSFFVGLFLANRALVPIQRSWEKQTQFVADASHELRTPLSVIQTHLELLFRHPGNTIEQESETIFKSLSEVKRVNKLVEDLLTLARTDSNEQLIRPIHFQIDKLTQIIVDQFEPIASMKEISLKADIQKELHYYGDKERMHQLFVILLDNALKFTPAGGTVSISCKRDGSFIKAVVEDTGVGIPEKDVPHIFDRFYRSSKSRSRSAGGTGLGLSIAKWIVKAHHGQINVQSKLNEGARFIIKLPILKESFK